MISVVVPVSAIRSHPETDILRETLASVRHHLPGAELFLCFDGVRPEQEDLRADYEEHIRRVLWAADKNDWLRPVVPYRFETHQHQTGMLRTVLDDIRTPLLLFVEQDTPLVTDEPIDWAACIDLLLSGEANSVRFSHEGVLPDAHVPMMHGLVGDFMRTSQFSARPHLASVAYYRRILTDYFSPNAKAFVEDLMHGVVDEAFKVDGMTGWAQHRLFLYHPRGGNLKRSWHADGRGGAPKYDGTQVF